MIYIYIYINKSYGKTETIESVVFNNFVINKESEKGQPHIYKPTEKNISLFKNAEENIASEIIYEGDMESNIKSLKISNQGGLVVFRFANDNIGTFISNDAEEVDYSKLLQNTKTTYDDLKATISFDMIINLTSGKIYKANISLELPTQGIIENGTSSQEITDLKNIVFKRIEN